MIDHMSIIDSWVAEYEENANNALAEAVRRELVNDVADVCADGVSEAFRQSVDKHGEDFPAHEDVRPEWNALLDMVGDNPKIVAKIRSLLLAQSIAVNGECLKAVRKFKAEKGIK